MTGTKIRLVVVEDVDADADLILHALRKGGFDPDAVRVEDEAAFIAMLQRPTDLIMCDYNLPQLTGQRVLEIAKRTAPHVPVVIVTGMDDEAAAATMKAGATDYVLRDNLDRLPRVTMRALEEVELRRTVKRVEARYQQLVESVPAVVYTAEAGPDGRWFYLGPQVETLLGVTVGSVFEDPAVWSRMVHPEDRYRVQSAQRHAVDTRTRLELEYRFVRVDGSIVWVRDEATVVDNATPYFHGVITDVTEAKLAEEALVAAEQTYRTLVQTVKGVVWRADARAGKLTFVSREAEDLLGYPLEDWTTKERFWESKVFEDDRVAESQRASRALHDHAPYVSEYRIVAADGRVLWVRDLVEVVVRDDEVVELVGLMVDITELKHAEQEAATRAEQQAAVVDLGQLALRGFSTAVLFDEAVQLLTSTLETPCALVTAHENDELAIVAAYGYGALAGSPGVETGSLSPERYSFDTQQPLVSLDVHGDPRFSFTPLPGEEGVVSGMCAPIRDEDGLFGVVSVYSTRERAFTSDDVNFLQAIANVLSTALRREASQREIAFQARLLYEVGASVCVTDASGTITHWNDAAVTTLGFEVDETIGRNVGELLLDPADVPAARAALSTIRPGDRLTTEWPFRTKDGRYVPFHLSVSAQGDPAGELDRIVVVGVDISERKEMEKRLRESEDQFRSAFISMPAGMMLCAEDGHYVAVNDAFCDMIGYERDELIGMSYVDITHPDDVAANREWYSRLVTTGGTVHVTKRYLRKDGSVVWAEVTDIVLRGDADEDFHALVYVLDVTERKRAEEEREALEKQLVQSQKMEAVGRLAGGIAHDFNNLLSVIINYSAFLDEDMPDEDPRKEDLKEIRAAGDRATALVRRLLTFSRREPGETSTVDLNEVITELRGLLERSIGEDISLEVDLPEEEFLVRADTTHLEQILMNLVVNARDAMPAGGSIRITSGIEQFDGSDAAVLHVQPGAYVRLTVEDTGEGIPPEVLDHVFEPFFTTKAREQGTGLGLSTVYGLVNQAGGAIRVDSTVGTGTTFDILLPSVEASTEPDAAAVPDAERAPEPPSSAPRTVLVVEDDEALRSVVKRALETRGYQVIDAASGPEALSLVDQTHGLIDILLTDVVMPGMPGTKLAERLHDMSDTMRFIFMTGHNADEMFDEERRRLLPGAFLQKPFSSQDLYDKIDEVIGV